MKPEVSVLLPCFNAARFLASCLESLSAQSFRDFEIIAVDDGSEDETPDLLDRAARQDPRIRVLPLAHSGIAVSLAAATTSARAPLLARMDADDLCHSDRLALQVGFLRSHPDVAVVSSRVELFPRTALKNGLLRYESWINSLLTHESIIRDLFVESPLPHPSVVMRKEALERVGGYRDCGWAEDYDLWMRMARAGVRFSKLPEILLQWRDWSGRASRADFRFSSESFLALKEHYLMGTFLSERSRVAIWGAGPIGKGWARRLKRRGIEVSHFVELDPRKVGNRIHGATVIEASEVERLAETFILVAVGAPSRRRTESGFAPARVEIRERMAAAGFVDGRDFVCLA